ncbi:putative abc transporter [Diplodia seriata]|uniref:Putative abc transporter n=1 Tax=Diplodia seriata TaxID=420778 RepID=A0A0G2G7P5_9PEZI|nr:putative abc transporter [Diplodia seriata]
MAEGEADPSKRTPKLSDYLRVFTYATRWDFCVYIVASIASIGAGVTLPLMNVIFGQLVNQFTSYFSSASPTSTASPLSRSAFERILNRQAFYILALFLGRWLLNAVNKFCFRMIGIRLSSAIRHAYLRALLTQPIHITDALPASAAPATAITTTSNTLQLGISERLGTFLQFTATVCAALAVAFAWDWALTLVTASLILYILAVLAFVLPALVKSQTVAAEADARATAVAGEALGGIRLVVACGAQGRVAGKYREWVREGAAQALKGAPVAGVQLGLIFFGVFAAFGLAFWYGTRRYVAGAFDDAGVVVVVLMSVMMILTSLERVTTPLMAVSKAMVAACELFAVIDAPAPAGGSLKPEVDAHDLVFDDVTFEYPSRPGVRALDGLSLRIRPGRNTALVGPSGSGKSTVVGLLERWYALRDPVALPQVVGVSGPKEKPDGEKDSQVGEQPEVPIKPTLAGSITVGGVNLEDVDLKWWRAQIGLVQQEPFLFNDTIFGNVANGLIGTEWESEPKERKRELVRDACLEAFAHDFISRLPDRYDTRVGDGGIKLSGGQKQRLAIARSIIKKPRIMILDEATSAIDAKSEKIVQVALDRVTRNRTTITIAHRLSTIKKADHIIVLQKGKEVEQGTHHSLTSDPSGVYSTLVRAQALHFPSTHDRAEVETPAPADIEEADSDKVAGNLTRTATTPDDSISNDPQTAPSRPRNLISNLAELLRDRHAPWPHYAGIVLSAMAVAAGTPIQAYLFAKVLGVFLLPPGPALSAAGDFWGLMWLALAAGVGAAYFFLGWLSLRVQYAVGAGLKQRYLGDLLHQPLAFFDADAHSHGALTARVAGDVKQLEECLGLNAAMLLGGVFTVAGCVATALAFGWKLGVVAMCVTMPVMLASGFWKYRHEVRFDQMNAAVFAESSQFATEAIEAMRTVSALAMENAIADRYRALLDGHVRAASRRAKWTAALFGFADSAGLGCQALIFWYGGGLLAKGEYSMEAFFVCFMAIIQGAEAASQVISIAPSAAQAAAAAKRMLDVRRSVETGRGVGTKDGCYRTLPASDGGVRIELRDVRFKYPTRDVLVFDGLSITVESGQYAALVGASGCGKTTIISLLERFYDVEPGHGAVLCNGVNVNDLDLYDYRQNLSLVAQETTLFRGTVRDNVLFGVADPSAISDERIHEVCRDAFIHDFIVSLPEGYDTDVGQKGVAMSGGQKQRIAIARALLRDPKILLLDEATSALDSESEAMVQAAFERARRGRTMIAVAHRLATIQTADVIFVFDDGRVVEKGTHDELVRKQGTYWELCQAQALDR